MIPSFSPNAPQDLGVEKVELDDLLARADFITLHTPMTPQTKKYFVGGKSRQNQKGRANRQLRARRARR